MGGGHMFRSIGSCVPGGCGDGWDIDVELSEHSNGEAGAARCLVPSLNPRRFLASKAGKGSGEGQEGAPVRHALAWNKEEFYDEKSLDVEMRRVFDVCHGCRRCFNLCNSFPKLFQLIDQSPSGELDSVPSAAFKDVADDCTLCDMCYLNKCPYTPPHALNIDFPHLILRYRAVENAATNKAAAKELNPVPEGEDAVKMGAAAGGMSMEGHGDPARTAEGVGRQLVMRPAGLADRELGRTDRNGKVMTAFAPLVNWATRRENKAVRGVMESLIGVHSDAELPKYASKPHVTRDQHIEAPVQESARDKVVLYTTCLVNYNMPAIGEAATAVLRHNGVDVISAYPQCCGMPQLENGDIADVARRAREVSRDLLSHVAQGRKVIALTPSCALMLKHEWPLILPHDQDVKKLAENTMDICEYVVSLAANKAAGGISTQGLVPVQGIRGVQLQHACHARAQNIGCQSAEMLRLIPQLNVNVVEKCSGHGGSWGCKTKTHPTAKKVGTSAAKALLKFPKGMKDGEAVLSSECPLAAQHLMQLVGELKKPGTDPFAAHLHPIQLLAAAYGLRPLENLQ